jgi:hypothetical protein
MSGLELLMSYGFAVTGEYVFNDADRQLTLIGSYSTAPGCYAFMAPDSDECIYVGVAQRSVKERVWDYRRPHPDLPDAPRSKLWALLAASPERRLRVMTLTTEAGFLRNGAPLPAKSIALAIEDAAISALQPRLNRKGCRRA